MENIVQILTLLDWPNLIGGATISLIVAFSTWILQGIWATYVASKDLPYRVSGRWFSAEYDPKGNLPRPRRNTLLEVRVARRLRGWIQVKAVRALNSSPDRVETKWKVRAKLVQGDTLVGTWKSTVKNTSRHGTAILKFLDYGRTVGYWTGPAGSDYPAYGYWVMARSEQDLRAIASSILRDTEFDWVDVARHVIEFPPPTKADSTVLRDGDRSGHRRDSGKDNLL